MGNGTNGKYFKLNYKMISVQLGTVVKNLNSNSLRTHCNRTEKMENK